MDLILRSVPYYLVLSVYIFTGYMIFMSTLLDFSSPKAVHHTTSCQNRCEVVLPNASVDKFKSLSLDKSEALFVHFMGNNLSSLQPPKDTEILDPLNLVWVESITAPFLSLDLGFNVYSLTTLWRKVRHISVTVEFASHKCLENISYSCVTASLATAFLTDVCQQRGALCYVINFNSSVKYKCCQKNYYTQKIECDIPTSIDPQMSGVFVAIIIVATIFFVCFPALFVGFPDEVDSLQTRSANVQVRNPLYRIANFVVQKLRHYSSRYYHINVINKLLIGCSLPILFYIDWGMILYTANYDIPQMFNNAVKKNWLEKNLDMVVFATLAYNITLIFISLLPRIEKLNFSFAPVEWQEKVEILHSLINNTHFEVDWTKPCSFAGKLFVIFCFGFKGICDGQTFLCWRVIKLVLSFLLILVLYPVSVLLTFIAYSWYISPLGRKIKILFSRALIYMLWLNLRCAESKTLKKWVEKLPWSIIRIVAYCIGIILGIVLCILTVIMMLSFAIIVSHSLLLISRLITYLCMGTVASKDDFLPIIALFSLFLFYIWNCFSSVGHTYKDLLDQTFKKCKKYQEKENKQIIIVDDEGAPRIPQLSVLFQNVVDKIHPFSKAYTVMCVRIAIIGSFLFLTYFAILVYGKTSLNDVTKTVAVSLAGLIPKLIEIFRSGNSKDFIKSDNAYRVGKIVQEFFDSGNGEQGENGETSERSTRNGTGVESPHSQLVRADVSPRLADINGDPSTETTPLLQSHRNTRGDIIVV